MPTANSPPRFRAAATVAHRYDDQPVLGLPASAMVISNSERSEASCPRRWWFSRAVGLNPPPSHAMRFGRAFDEAMGRLFAFYGHRPGVPYTVAGLKQCPSCRGAGSTQRMFPSTGLAVDCPCCDGTGLGAWALAAQEMAATPEVFEEHGGLEHQQQRVYRALEGWLHTYDRSMADDYRVLGVQVTLACPITSPSTGEVYRSKVPVVDISTGWRIANGHDAPETVRLVTLPWFQLVKLDAVVQEVRSGHLRAWETKTSQSPESFSHDLLLDTQLPGYVRALWYATQELGLYDGARPAGWVWDVASSVYQRDPTPLKAGGYSMSKNQTVPSWRWEHALAQETLTAQQAGAEHERLLSMQALHQTNYDAARDAAKTAGRGAAGVAARATRDSAKQTLALAKDAAKAMMQRASALEMVPHARGTVDPRLYVRRWGTFTPERLREYELELFADATRISSWLRAAPGTGGAPWQRTERVALHWPRVPLCRMPGGHCRYTGPCLEDSPEVRANYEPRQPLRWLNSAALAAQRETDK